MSFGFSVADLKEVLKLSKWLWDNCFDKDNTADERYARFGRSIANLRRQIIRLENVISSTVDELGPHDPENDALKREFMEVVGDFIEAIDKCNNLLTQHIKLDRNRAGFLTNVIWGVKVQEDVDELTRQLQVHAQRLTLVAEPVKYNVLQELRQGMAELVDRARRLDPELKAQASDLVPGWLAEVFEANAANTPSTARSISNIPVKEGCDLLHRHFSRRCPDPKSRAAAVRNYLTLLKCQWIVNILRNTGDFPTYRYGSAFPQFVSNVEMQIYQDLQTISRTPRAGVSEQELRALLVETMEPFLIWEPPKVRPVISVTDKKEGEEQVTIVSLACEEGHKEDLIVFRKGNTSFRFVPTEEVDGEVRPSQYLKPETMNLRIDKFVARYAIDSRLSIEIYQDNSRVPVTYELKGLRDAWSFQRAITGYEVAGSERNVKWSAQRSIEVSRLSFSAGSRKEELFGCVQIWRWNPMMEAIQSDESVARSSTESPRSPKSSSPALHKEAGYSASLKKLGSSPQDKEFDRLAKEAGYNTASPPQKKEFRYSASEKELAGLPSRKEFRYTSSPKQSGHLASPPPSIAPSQRTTTTFTFVRETELPQGKHVELQPPIPPAIVFLGYPKKKHTCYYLELNSDLLIDRSACPCTPDGDGGDCRILVIQHRKGDKFKVRELSVDAGSVNDWNLAIFRGTGRPDEYSNPGVVKTMRCETLLLLFRSAAERKRFSEDFDFVMGQYDEAAEEYSKERHRLQHGGDRPTGPSKSMYDSRSPRSSVISTSGTALPDGSRPPHLGRQKPRFSFADILRRKE